MKWVYLQGTQALHRVGLGHGDLKPAKIQMLSSSKPAEIKAHVLDLGSCVPEGTREY